MLAVVGVIVLGALIFATYYIGSINKNIDQLEEIDPDLSQFVPVIPGGTFPSIPGIGITNPLLCGNNVINAGEQCDPPGSSANCIDIVPGATGGTATCNNLCQWNTTSCIGYAPTCGDGFFDGANEVCDVVSGQAWYSGNPSCTQYCIDSGLGITGSGNISCNITVEPCDIDYSGCVCDSSPFKPFLLKLEPTSGSANQNIGFPTNLSVDFDPDGTGNNTSEWVDVNVTVQTDLGGFIGYTDVCKYDNVTIPANASGLYINRFEAVSNMPKIKDVSCSEDGVYTFTFKGIDNANNIGDDIIFTFTVPLQDNDPLCVFQGNSTGSFDVCVNQFQSGTVTNSNGSATFFVNHPDYSEANQTGSACHDAGSLGDVCFSLGFT